MASNQPPDRSRNACPICLETSWSLKILPNCQHTSCRKCLTKHILVLSQEGKKFQCQTCHAEYPLSQDGVDDLIDYDTAEDVDDEFAKDVAVGAAAVAAQCDSCLYTKGSRSDADNLCQECGNAYLCQNCTSIHKRNKVTSNHVVLSLKSLNKKKLGGKCRSHGKFTNSYCCTCSKECCYICVLLEHGEHDVKTMSDVFRSLVKEVTSIVDEYEKGAKDLRKYAGSLKCLKYSDVSKRRDALLQQIEDDAEMGIQRIIEQKNARKEEVLSTYNVTTEVDSWLAKVPSLPELDNVVATWRTLQPQAEPHPYDIARLVEIKTKLVDMWSSDSGKFVSSEIDIKSYWKSYMKLFNRPLQFLPDENDFVFGNLKSTDHSPNSIQSCKLIFERELEVDDEAKYVPSVANLGNGFYAVAHPITQGHLPDAVDIYKVPGAFQRTISEGVKPFYDMASTVEGKLAILSKGNNKDSCCIELYDPDSGQRIHSTKDLPIQSPLSFDVNGYFNQFVILSSDQERKIVIVDENGSIVFSNTVPKLHAASKAFKIACLVPNDFVLMSQKMIVIYRRNGDSLIEVTSSKDALDHISIQMQDISASQFCDITLVFNFDRKAWCRAVELIDDCLSLLSYKEIGKEMAEERISVRARRHHCVI